MAAEPNSVTFETTVAVSGNNTGIMVPEEAIEQLAAGKRPPVLVSVNGYEYRNTVAVMGGKWKVVILFRLQDGTRRFGELRRAIPGVSERVLAQQLRELERDGVVRRVVHPEVPPRVEYSLTDYGRTLRPITDLMCAWGQAHRQRLAGGDAGVEPDPLPPPAVMEPNDARTLA